VRTAVRGSAKLVDRAAQDASEQERGSDRQGQPEETGHTSLHQASNLSPDGVLGKVAPDQPRSIGVIYEGGVQIDVLLPCNDAPMPGTGSPTSLIRGSGRCSLSPGNSNSRARCAST
jgi:hypothetical protein